MRTVVIRGKAYQSILEVHLFLEKELSFPYYYGRNLDALHDVLTERTAADEELCFIVLFSKNMDEELTRKLERMLVVLRDCADENPGLQVIAADEREA